MFRHVDTDTHTASLFPSLRPGLPPCVGRKHVCQGANDDARSRYMPGERLPQQDPAAEPREVRGARHRNQSPASLETDLSPEHLVAGAADPPTTTWEAALLQLEN